MSDVPALGRAGALAQIAEVLAALPLPATVAIDGVRGGRAVYRKAGRPCPRCGENVPSRGQGDDNRIAYWCPRCQPAGDARSGA